MAWSKRAPERIYAIAMWIISIVLAGFLIGFGGLVIGDLPRVESPVSIQQFIDPAAADENLQAQEASKMRIEAIERDLRAAHDLVETERGNYQSAYDSFQNWLAARQATTDPAQDPEVISRTSALDILKQRERDAERAVETLQTEERAARSELSQLEASQRALMSAARPRYERAKSSQELRVFLLRLAITLPLLILAFWMTAKHRQSRHWPLMRGFVLFSAFAFFVELVPYLPSYGGYVRFGVGIVLTLVAGHYVMKWMRRYLEQRREAERLSEDQRRRSVAYEDALKKLAEKTCPGCDRKVMSTDDAVADFCVHCGMRLFDHCASCDTRKVIFYRFCMVCGSAGSDQATA